MVSFADSTAATITGGDLQIIGRLATWATVGSGAALPYCAGQKDYMAVMFSPGFVGDRTIAAVGANATDGVTFQLIKDATKMEVRAPVPIIPSTGATTIDYDAPTGGVANFSIVSADIALPSDFDPTTSSGRESFACYGSQTTFTDNDVYRIDDGTIRDLDAVTALAVKSVAYTGVIDEGTLFIGEYAENNVKHTSDPWVSIPSWKSTKKAPSPTAAIGGVDPQTIVRVSPTDANVVFAGTSSNANSESAFSISNNAAVSFNAESLIDSVAANTVVTVDDIYLTPDGSEIFMATDDGTQLSLWKSTTPTSSTSWSRVYVFTSANPSIVRLNPDWDTTPAVYYAELVASGSIFVSKDGGDIFSTQTAPAALPTDMVVENATTLYVASTTNVYKSVYSAWTFGTPVDGKAGVIRTLAMAPSYPAIPEEGNLLVGGTTACSYSLDGGTVFTKISGGLSGTALLQVLAHEDYADNNTIFCGDTTGASNQVYRFVIGESTSWESQATGATSAISGLAMANGVLYASQAAAADGAMRTLYPTGTIGRQAWEEASANAAATSTLNQAPSALRAAAGSNVLYAIDTVLGPPMTVLAYSDLLATDVPSLTSPAAGAIVNIDPVSGRADDIQFAWSTMGSGTGLVDDYEINIAVAGTSFAAPLTQRYFTGAAVAGTVVTGLNTTNPQLSVGTTGQWVQNLTANTNYEWRIRARDQISGDTIRSGWSAAGSFSIQAGGVVQQPYGGPMLQSPTGGATDVSLTPGFSWSPIAKATEYEFILATDAGLTSTIAGTPATLTSPAFQVTAPLEYGTVYFWAVRSTAPTVSTQGIGSFTTMAEPAAVLYTCAQCGLVFDSEAALEAHIAEAHAPVTTTPSYIWGIIAIGAVLVIVVIVLIVRTRRVV